MKLLMLLVLSVLVIAPLQATTIDFDSLTPGDGPAPWFPPAIRGESVTTQYGSQGALFHVASDPQTINFVSNASFWPAAFSGNYLMVNTVPFFSADGSIEVSFVSPADNSVAGWVDGDSISVTVSDTEYALHAVLIETLDIHGDLVESWTLGSLHAGHGFGSGDVHTIRFTDLGGDGFAMDDLSFGPIHTEAPEPGTLALLGAGVIGLALSRLRRKA